MFVFVTLETSASSSIPVRIAPSNSPSNDSDQRVDRSALCLLCNQPFDDVLGRHFCPECDERLKNTEYHDVSSRPSTRSRSTNMYSSRSDRGYSPVLSPTPKTRPARKIICPHCRNPNLLQNLTHNSEYRCTACQKPIPSSYLY
jgi:DNA-directed RNA polymerase subunit RPC12/RpoP